MRAPWSAVFVLLTTLGTFAAERDSKASIDPKAVALLKKSRDAMRALRSYRAECRTVQRNVAMVGKHPPFTYQLGLLVEAKPNLMRYDSWNLKASPVATGWMRPTTSADYIFVSDGRKQWLQFGQQYRIVDGAAPETLGTVLEPWKGFFFRENSIHGDVSACQKAGQKVSVSLDGREAVAGVPCDKVTIQNAYEYDGTPTQTRITVFLGPDGLVRRQTLAFSNEGRLRYVQTAELLRIEKNPDLRAMRYVYTPPKGVKLEVVSERPPLLANGTLAPDFSATDRNGKAIRLSDLKGKVVVLDFWASWCGPCMSSMPHTQSVADKLQKEELPVVIFAVDDGESREAFADWIDKKGARYPALSFAYSPKEDDVSGRLYKVTGIPSQYVIDASGTIRASFVGYDGPTDALERAVRAAVKGN